MHACFVNVTNETHQHSKRLHAIFIDSPLLLQENGVTDMLFDTMAPVISTPRLPRSIAQFHPPGKKIIASQIFMQWNCHVSSFAMGSNVGK